MRFWAGTSGYSYKEWKGSFYPDKLPAKDMLRHYAQQLPVVEINSTFYRMPRADVLRGWTEQVPETFRFVIKASRRITHLKRLKDVGDDVQYLYETLEVLENRLGAVLFQLPPNLKKDMGRLEAFMPLLPRGVRAALEFRHESWFDEEVRDCLHDHDAALCLADTGEDGSPGGDELRSTASWGYVRLRRPEYTRDELTAWADRFRGQGWSDAFVFFKHEDEAGGPRMAAEFLGIVG